MLADGAPMPVTARLSKRFYDRLGEDVANELVDWFNAVDATYRADLRELNELNFARFDAKLEQRLAELEAKLNATLHVRIGHVERRIDRLDAKVDQTAAELRATLERGLKEQTRWLLLAWVSLLIPILGLWIRV